MLKGPAFPPLRQEIELTSRRNMMNIMFNICRDDRQEFTTFLHAIHIFDRVLSLTSIIRRTESVMVACASLMLASKLEEIYVSFLCLLIQSTSFTLLTLCLLYSLQI